jgi:Ni/Co efflux regulator RcnB
MLALGPFGMAALASASAQDRGDQRPDEHRHFADHDREVVQGWYEQHRRTPPPGLRDSDRLDASVSAKITVGAVLDSDLRRHVHTVPSDLLRQLPAPQRGDRYYFVDGQLCLVDNHYQVEDVIRLNGR